MNWYKKAKLNISDEKWNALSDLEKEQHIKEEHFKKFPEKISIPSLSQFILRPTDKSYCKLVNINVDEFDRLFQNNKDQYIGKSGTLNAVKGRYQGFLDFLREGKQIEAPTINFNEEFNQIEFTNGRHRYSVLRDMGMKIMPVSIDINNIEIAKKSGILT